MDYYQSKEIRYEQDLDLFLARKINKDKTEIDFINFKLDNLDKLLVKALSFSEEETEREIKKELDKFKGFNFPSKINYEQSLKDRLEEAKYRNKRNIHKCNKDLKFYKKKLKLMQLLKREEIIDLRIEKNTEKIVLLYQLGILEFLKNKEPFNTSVNKLATIISAITGIKPTTTQSYLNPMLNENTDQKSNPLNTIKSVEKIKQKLLSIGYDLDDIK